MFRDMKFLKNYWWTFIKLQFMFIFSKSQKFLKNKLYQYYGEIKKGASWYGDFPAKYIYNNVYS